MEFSYCLPEQWSRAARLLSSRGKPCLLASWAFTHNYQMVMSKTAHTSVLWLLNKPNTGFLLGKHSHARTKPWQPIGACCPKAATHCVPATSWLPVRGDADSQRCSPEGNSSPLLPHSSSAHCREILVTAPSVKHRHCANTTQQKGQWVNLGFRA